MKDHIDHVEEVFAEACEMLERACAISSPSRDTAGLRSMAELIADRLEILGLRAEIHDESDRDGVARPVLVARSPGDSRRPVLALGHLDTVLTASAPALVDGCLMATGALDMKGGLVAFLGALDLLRRHGESALHDLLLVAAPDEEVGGLISERLVRAYGAEARAVLVLEPGEQRPDSETLVTGRRGLISWRLEATGQAAHSGLAYWSGRSAVAAAAAWCSRAQALSAHGAGPTINVGRILGGDADLVDDLAGHHALIGTRSRLNIVADRCLAEGEIRFLRQVDGERLFETLARLAAEVAARSEVEMHLVKVEEISPVDPNGPGLALAERLVEKARDDGWTLELESDRGGVSFPNFLPDPSLIPVLDGLGPVGSGMHTRDELLDLRSLKRRIRLLAALLQWV